MNENEKESVIAARPETRVQKRVRVVLRWGLVALSAFVLGGLLITLTLYLPSRQKLDRATTELERAGATISDMTDQITTLKAENVNLQGNLDATTLHMVVLRALSGARGASLAVVADDYAGARLSLIQATEALDALPGLLGNDQGDVISALQQSADQALADVQADLKSAQPELDQLIKNLVQLEDGLFPNP